MKSSYTSKKNPQKKLPWQSPLHLCIFFLALFISTYLIISMPETQKTKWVYNNDTQSMQEVPTKKNKVSDKETEIISQNDLSNSNEHVSQEIIKKIIKKLKYFSNFFALVGLAAFFAGLMEARSWHTYLGKFLGKITKAARLPQVIGISMPVALYSNASANAILVSSHSQREISTFSLITGGMANSYLAHFSHSIRVLYPVVALIGLPGLLYFIVQLFGGFLVIVIAFCINRYKNRELPIEQLNAQTSESYKKVLAWKDAIKLGFIRAFSLLFRMTYITIPLMLGMEWLLKSGAFNFWEQYIPVQIARYFPAELMSIIIAQIGGLVQSAGVSANLYVEGLVHQSQILLAMLVASAVGNPIRTLRRNLPTALGVFPPKVAFFIVFTMQFARLLITIIGSLLVILWMNIYLFN